MASGFTMVTHEGKGAKTVAAKSGKSATSKPAGKQKVSGGSGHMEPFKGASPQKPGVTARTNSTGKGAPFAKGGGGSMHGFSPVKAQKSGRSSQS